jgi:indole-3-glycerol phosphate synthase
MMDRQVPDILKQILADKRCEIAARKSAQPLAELRRAAQERHSPPAFAAALRTARPGLIAEVKHRSPSAGVIRAPFRPAEIASAYQRAGAQAVSVLIDEKHFGGGEDIMREVRQAISLPLLYKEFVIDEWQVWHAAALGASAILLIAAALPEPRLRELMDAAGAAGLEVLFETHDAEEMELAGRLGSKLTGINNRDLRTFNVSLDTTIALARQAPAGSLLVSESGIRTHSDIELLAGHGIDAVLVGQQLLEKGKDPAAEIKLLMQE